LFDGFKISSNHMGYEMSNRLRVTALKILMIGRARGQFELWEEGWREDNDDKWKKLLLKVQDYAACRRLEANYAKNQGDPMDITAVNDYCGNQEEWGDEWRQGPSGYSNIDALGTSKGKGFKEKGRGDNKGKGKGKPMVFHGQCYSCGEQGNFREILLLR